MTIWMQDLARLLLFLHFISFIAILESYSMEVGRGLRSIVPNYDYFIIDQWGVLHDGKKVYDGVIDCLQEMHKIGKKMILLSNSSKKKVNSEKGLRKVGIDPDMFISIITSGDIGWHMMREKRLQFMDYISQEKLKVFVIGNADDDEEYIDSCGCEFAEPSEADFVLARGTFSINRRKYDSADILLKDVASLLMICKERKLPMLITNPDWLRPGGLTPMPGQIGDLYSKLASDARIEYVGKPYSLVYQECFKSFGSISKEKVLCIGDSLDHDILGGFKSGLDTLFISNGVHCGDLGTEEASPLPPLEERLVKLLESHPQAKPTCIVPSFVW